MILTCPACGTRYQADEAKFPPDGRMVRCAKCSHVWHQAGLSRTPEPDLAIIAPEPERETQPGFEPAPESLLSRTRAFTPKAA